MDKRISAPERDRTSSKLSRSTNTARWLAIVFPSTILRFARPVKSPKMATQKGVSEVGCEFESSPPAVRLTPPKSNGFDIDGSFGSRFTRTDAMKARHGQALHDHR